MRKRILYRLFLVQLAVMSLVQLPMCSSSGTTPMPDSIEPGNGGQITFEAPMVRFYPQDERAGVITNTNIELYFSVDMDRENGWRVQVKEYDKSDTLIRETTYVEPSSVEPEGCTAEGVSWQRRALTINPAISFTPGNKVTVSAEGFLSAMGVPMIDDDVVFWIVNYNEPGVTIAPTSYYNLEVNPATRFSFTFDQLVRENNGWSVTITEQKSGRTTTYPNGSPNSEIRWEGRVLTIKPSAYFPPGETVSVSAQGFKTVFADMDVTVAPVSFDISDRPYPTIGIGTAHAGIPLTRFEPLLLDFSEDFDVNCDWVVELDLDSNWDTVEESFTIDSGFSPNLRELYIDHDGYPFPLGATVRFRARNFMTPDGYPFDEKECVLDVQSHPQIATQPQNGQKDISVTAQIALVFDELVNTEGTWEVRIDEAYEGVPKSQKNYSKDLNANAVTWDSSDTATTSPRSVLVIVPGNAGQIFQEGSDVTVTIVTDFSTAQAPTAFEFKGLTYKTVYIPVTGIGLIGEIFMEKDDTRQLCAKIEPANASYPGVTWESDAKAVAVVDGSGKVTALSQGTASIKATSVDNAAVWATCVVTVQQPDIPGNKESVVIDDTAVVITYVQANKTFPTGAGDGGTATISVDYQLGETEVTLEQWSAVYDWAVANNYSFANAGSGSGGANPVTHVSWRDAVVWCNAFTEYYNSLNEPDLTCVYKYSGSIIKNSTNGTECDNATADSSATGFRLPTSLEWEYAARWRDNSTNTVAGYSNPWFTRGNSLSHATAYFQNNAASHLVGVFYTYWDDTLTGDTCTMPAKSREPNSLGLYDMSGNVWELCFDKNGGGPQRLMRGGSWCNKADMLQLGVLNSVLPNDVSAGVGPYVGFRVAKKKLP